MENPAELTDEQLDAAIEGKTEEPQPSEPAKAEPAPTEEEEEQPEGEVQEEAPEEQPEEPAEEEPISRRKAQRLEKLESLVSKLKSPTQAETPKQKQEALDYAKALDADPEVIAQLEADRKNYGQSQADAAAQQAYQQAASLQFHTRLEIDAPKVEAKYSKLNTESPDFDPNLADSVNNWYLSTVGYDSQSNTVANPNVRYADFVEGIMELADRVAGEKVAKTSKNIARQAASTGIRPDGSAAKSLNLNKAPDQMTDEELDAVIGTLPRDAQGRFVGR